MIDLAATGDPLLRHHLEAHPKVAKVGACDHLGIEFQVGAWHRKVWLDQPGLPVAGLVELIDNNPMVCADEMSIPDALSTLALVALGPIAWAGMIVEPPTVVSSFESSGEMLDSFLATAGWQEGATSHVEPRDLGPVLAITAMAAIATPGDWSDIDDVYEERFGRSFFVRRIEDSEWEPKLVEGMPFAAYRLRYTPGEGHSLLTIQVLADRHGKCGPAQAIHAMNVMAGFEESLGVA
ncbi:MAG: hypothetical protein H7Y17_12180 [Chlorobia bacterium]|nr:hypothetical protein [Fimbriimonadaceae bacterium]